MKDNKLIKGIEFGEIKGEISDNQDYLDYNFNQPQSIIKPVTEEDIINNAFYRDTLLDKVYVIQFVSNLITLPDDVYSTVDMTAQYFQVDKNTIEKLISRNYQELSSNGLIIISGERLKNYKNKLTDIMSVTSETIDIYISKFSPSITLLNKRVILNIAMLLRDSFVSKEIRRILLDTLETPQGMNVIILTMYNNMNSYMKEQKEMKDCLNKISEDIESRKPGKLPQRGKKK